MTNEAWDEANQASVIAGKPQKVAKNATFTGFGGSSRQNKTVLVRFGRARRRKGLPGRARSPAKSQPGGQWQFGVDEWGKKHGGMMKRQIKSSGFERHPCGKLPPATNHPMKQDGATYSSCRLLQIKNNLNGIQIFPSLRRFCYGFLKTTVNLIQQSEIHIAKQKRNKYEK